MSSKVVIVGQGLAGTLVALEAEARGIEFVVVDQGSGNTASRVAAGLFNPLTGPRFSADSDNWPMLVPHYRELEHRLGVGFLRPIPLLRPWKGAKIGPSQFPRSAPGWTATARADGVLIEGGGWMDVPILLDAARNRWLRRGVLEERTFGAGEGRGQRVIWCGGLADLTGQSWNQASGIEGRWQGVRGDLLTIEVPRLKLEHAEVGARFLMPLGADFYRWGATHESDVLDFDDHPWAKDVLLQDLVARLGNRRFSVVDHRWGVRPASREKTPLVVRHPDEPAWTLFNGFGGRGVALIPRWLSRLGW